MYCEYYGFGEKPFAITPNPRFLFLSDNHRQAFAHLLYGIRNRCGFIELTGEVGTGKTTVLRTLLEQLDESDCRVAIILNPRLSAPELLTSICREYGLPGEGSMLRMTEELNSFLLQENREGRTVVLVIDEAQNLEPAVLEQVRLLSNLETESEKLIQIVLAGQPELRELLRRPELRQLSQRITVSYHLKPLGGDDTLAYIAHRMSTAGAKGVKFTPGAVKKIFRWSQGVPRLVNVLCDRTLLVAYTRDGWIIDGSVVSEAIRELGAGSPRRRFAPPALAALLLFLLVASVICVAAIRRAAPPAPAAPAAASTRPEPATPAAPAASPKKSVKR